MNKFEFINGSRELLGLVQPLWEKLRKYHETKSSYFFNEFKNFKFEVRKNKFIKDSNIQVKIDLIKDTKKDLYIGYCISTINKDLIGEIDSIFVEEEYRKYGLGEKLMNMALEWLNNNNVKIKVIAVAEGNEDVIAFYQRHGFYKRRVILEQIQ